MSKKYLNALGVILVMLALLLSPNICISAAKDGLLLWFNKVLPSLLPFIILINILSGLNVMGVISSIASPLTRKLWKLPGSSLLIFIMGFVAGYPMGAKMVKELLDNGTLSPCEAQKTLCFSNNCGPLFIIGTIGALMLSSTSKGYFLLLIHVSSALLVSLIFSFYDNSVPTRGRGHSSLPNTSTLKFSVLFNESIKNAMDTIVYIGGYIIFFCVLAKIITASSIIHYILHSPFISSTYETAFLSLVTGLLELSNGASLTSMSNLSTVYSLALIAFMIGFGGLCVHFQASYILGNCGFSLAPYIISKFMQGILSFILVYLFYPIFSGFVLKTPLPFEIKWIVALVILYILFLYIIKYLNSLYHHKHMTASEAKYTYHYE